MDEKIKKIIESLKNVEEVVGIAVFSKFSDIQYSSLPEWIDSNMLIKLINTILETSNIAIKELRQGEILRTTIESTLGNILISVVGKDIVIFITKKGVQLVQLLNKLKKERVLEFKI